jgi:hypothetical protein
MLGRVVVVANGVEVEVRRRLTRPLAAVVLDQAGTLDLRDPRLAGLDRVQDDERSRQGAASIAGPGLDAALLQCAPFGGWFQDFSAPKRAASSWPPVASPSL